MTEVQVRAAAASDAEACAAIYNQGIAGREATFRTEPSTVDEWRERIGDPTQPLLVAEEEGGRVVGWAAAVRPGERCAEAGAGDYVIYVDAAARGHGIGWALLECLVDAAGRAGYWKLTGRIFTTNATSVALARRCGFREVGIQHRQGELDGEWKDVLLVERLLKDGALREGR